MSTTGQKYRTIVADPPWDYGSHGFATHGHRRNMRTLLPYEAMDVAAICGLPISDLSAPDSRIFVWTTNRYLRDAFDVVAAWGFSYAQTLVWHKTGNPSPLTGGVAPIHAEFLLVATRGHPPQTGKLASSVVSANKPPFHGRKPEIFLDLIEQVSPGPYLELFARRQRLGWDTWGNEALNHVEMAS